MVKQPSKDKERNVMHLIILVLAQPNTSTFQPRFNSTFPTGPVNLLRPVSRPQRFPTNSQVFGQTQNNRNVFKPNPSRTLPQTTPMSTSTRISFKPEHNSTAQQQPKQYWIAEELFNRETESNNTYEVPGNESFVCDQTVAEPQNSDTYFTDQYCEYYTQDNPETDHVEPPQNFQKHSFIDHKT
ncbi:unnamed protein product [Acanthoscelides obtectus]|uniref:Uncharacterized protein n=1 Tax=Acanthoscelides obtectus TaxID=200917 RepID=A0A9P0KHN1_ACAOB|nr:unnamed protein product [Acanthoscelides obtectus]CAK1656361.1 hypothetical protein AOBTE_LOCUS19669 [Acanthoscelides obtectus]